MSFSKRQNTESRTVNQLPNQASPPSFKQLQDLLQNLTRVANSSYRLQFGTAPEEYVLSLYRQRTNTEAQWSLYRCEDGQATTMVWDKKTNNVGDIHQLVSAQFPGFDLKPIALDVETEKDISRVEQRIKDLPTFEGQLDNSGLLISIQSIAMNSGSGRFDLESGNERACIYFSKGKPVHCFSRGLEGENSFLEVLGWSTGRFQFSPSTEEVKQRTISCELITLLEKSTVIEKQWLSLKEVGYSDTGIVSRPHVVAEQQFTAMVKPKTEQDLNLYKRLYLLIDGKTSLRNLVRRCNLPRVAWVPAIANFQSLGLIRVLEPTSSTSSMASADYDNKTASVILDRQDTGITGHSGFLFYLRNEMRRWQRFNRPFSVILFQINEKSEGQNQVRQTLSIQAQKQLALGIRELLAAGDIFAHYEAFGFALLLPETNIDVAKTFAARIVNALPNFQIRAGVACIPDSCSDLETLLGTAKPKSVADIFEEATTNHFKDVIDNAPDALCSLDAQMKLTEINPAFEKMVGYTQSELIGFPFSKLFVNAEISVNERKLKDLMTDATASSTAFVEIKLQSSTGEILDFQWSIRWSPEKQMMFCVGRDISAQKEMERLKSELVRMVSHDLRSPTMALGGFLELIQQDIASGPNGQRLEKMHRAAQSATSSIEKLVNDLLAFEQINDSMVELDYTSNEVITIFELAAACVADSASRINIQQTSLRLDCDRNRVVQVLVNLLGNAKKFSPADSPINLLATEDATHIIISVADSGPGIPKESLDTIFLPFKQVSEAKLARKGFGLGLSIAKALTELHRGHITLESTVGVGSTFSVWLPKSRV